MREILFRGKRLDTGEWVEGYYVQRAVTGSECLHWIYPAGSPTISKSLARELRPLHSAKSTQKKVHEIFPVDPSTVGQYTGLTDKNGRKIFEGDVVKRFDNERAYQVKWNPTFPAFWCIRQSDYKFLLTEGFEVIGSIHDNPELLEG